MNAGLYQYLFKFQFRKTRHDVHVLLWLRHQNKLEVFGLNCSICLQAAFNEIAMKWCSFRCHQGINRKILEARTIHDGVQNSSSYISPCSIFTVKNLWIRWTGYWICLCNALGLTPFPLTLFTKLDITITKTFFRAGELRFLMSLAPLSLQFAPTPLHLTTIWMIALQMYKMTYSFKDNRFTNI